MKNISFSFIIQRVLLPYCLLFYTRGKRNIQKTLIKMFSIQTMMHYHASLGGGAKQDVGRNKGGKNSMDLFDHTL